MAVRDIPAAALNPVETWPDKGAFARQADRLVRMFIANFERFAKDVDADILEGSPRRLG
jgi:phosphoenolpyruvate carboxykinase (ATP)